MKRTSSKEPLDAQMKRSTSEMIRNKKQDGDFSTIISTGSTLLDLAISGGRINGGGLPGGILVEIFGPSGTGKTVLLCEIAGAIQRKNGDVMFHDPEARLNKQFARMFDLDTDSIEYTMPDTVTEVFESIKNWEPKGTDINGVCTDSLAALSTEMELEAKGGDKMGMRRAKEFSEGLRKLCRHITKKNLLMVCSNQIRVNVDPQSYQKYTTPGGEAIGFYASVRLKMGKAEKIKREIKVAGKIVKQAIGIEVSVEVFKNSVWKPYHTAPVIILFDYGIDDIRANLQYIKDFTKNTTYTVSGHTLDVSMEKAIKMVEERGLVKKLRSEVIALWTEIEEKFETERKPKQR